MKKAYLLLEDGHVFAGESFGAEAQTVGELVFHTSVVGYVENLTDPCYEGQIVLHTFPVVGNYGWIEEDMASARSFMKGIVVREWCEDPSNFRAGVTIDEYLKQQGIPGISGVDTREITQILRDKGTMNAMITTDVPDNAADILKNYQVQAAAAKVGTEKKKEYLPESKAVCHVALLDYGTSNSIFEELTDRGCAVTAYPKNSTAEDVLSDNPDGVVLSEGPGDPMEYKDAIGEIKKIFGKIPVLGIGLGHELLALAAGAQTVKLPYGHHGGNQPAREISTGRVFITAQNHGYAVLPESLNAAGGKVTYLNVNDGSCEGVVYAEKQAMSLQFHPHVHTGSKEMEYGLEKFISLMGGEKLCR